MIRKFGEDDLPVIMQIWLDSNIQAHSFISEDYWKSNFQMVMDMLPQAEVYVYEDPETSRIEGFIGATGDYIQGIFVRDECRSKGIGKQLLDHVKKLKTSLSLHAYEKNVRAVAFYLREQFAISHECTDDDTDEKEYLMIWRRSWSASAAKWTAL